MLCSLERIQGYIDIEHEPNPNEEGKPPASWPTSGDLRVDKLSARYSRVSSALTRLIRGAAVLTVFSFSDNRLVPVFYTNSRSILPLVNVLASVCTIHNLTFHRN